MPKKHKHIKVIDRKLGRDRVWGWAHYKDNLIELDVRLKGYRRLLYLIHEMLHIIHPEWSETKVRKVSSLYARQIWYDGFRKVELK